MIDFKRPYQQALFECFILGKTIAEAAREAGCSWPTASKFRTEFREEILKAQSESVSGVLERLKKLLPDAAGRLEFWLRRPDLDAVDKPGYVPPLPLPPGVMPRSHIEDMRTVAAVRELFDAMRDTEMEQRMRALEKRLAELVKPPEPGEKKA